MTDLATIKKALEGATPGPWSVEYKHGTTRIETGAGCTMCDEPYYPWVPGNAADWQLIALAPDMARMCIEQADRIEELEAKLQWVIRERDDTFVRMLSRAEEAEAKLEKAVAFAEIVEKCGNGPLWDLARATLAELTGGKDE